MQTLKCFFRGAEAFFPMWDVKPELRYEFFPVFQNIGMGKHIHIIDDDKTTQSLLHAALTKRGFEVSMSSDSYEIFDMADNLPDLFLLDVIVPGLNGLEICKWVKSQNPYIPIIILSGTPGLKVLAESCHADDYLQKPIEISVLVQKIKTSLRNAELHVGDH